MHSDIDVSTDYAAKNAGDDIGVDVRVDAASGCGGSDRIFLDLLHLTVAWLADT